jgi:hypothetical protein
MLEKRVKMSYATSNKKTILSKPKREARTRKESFD